MIPLCNIHLLAPTIISFVSTSGRHVAVWCSKDSFFVVRRTFFFALIDFCWNRLHVEKKWNQIHKNNLLLSSTFLFLISTFSLAIYFSYLSTARIIPPIIHKLRSFNHSNNHKSNGMGLKQQRRGGRLIFMCVWPNTFFSFAINIWLRVLDYSSSRSNKLPFRSDADT